MPSNFFDDAPPPPIQQAVERFAHSYLRDMAVASAPPIPGAVITTRPEPRHNPIPSSRYYPWALHQVDPEAVIIGFDSSENKFFVGFNHNIHYMSLNRAVTIAHDMVANGVATSGGLRARGPFPSTNADDTRYNRLLAINDFITAPLPVAVVRPEFPVPIDAANTICVFYRNDTSRYYVKFGSRTWRYCTFASAKQKILMLEATSNTHPTIYPRPTTVEWEQLANAGNARNRDELIITDEWSDTIYHSPPQPAVQDRLFNETGRLSRHDHLSKHSFNNALNEILTLASSNNAFIDQIVDFSEGQLIERVIRHLAYGEYIRRGGKEKTIYGGERSVTVFVNSAKRKMKKWLKKKTGVEYSDAYTLYDVSLINPLKIITRLERGHLYQMWPHEEDNASVSCCVCGSRNFYTNSHERDDNYYCDDHFRTASRNNLSRVWNYGKNVREVVPALLSLKSDKAKKGQGNTKGSMLYFGVELEVVPRSQSNQDTLLQTVGKSIENFAIMKSDSSLDRGGFEIVTAPATLEYHRQKGWNKFFSRNEDDNVPARFVKSWNTSCCGIHVHFTRAALTTMQLSKFLVFFHEPNNNSFLSRIAGREVGPNVRFCFTNKKRLAARKKVDRSGKISFEEITSTQCHEHHYAACVSDRNGGKTVEVRIFRGNSTKHGIMRCLDFVAAVIDWCGDVGATQLNWSNFVTWFNKNDNRGRYPDLWRHMVQLGFLRTKHVSKGKKVLEPIPDSEAAA